MTITAKLNLMSDEEYGDIGDADEWGYRDVIFDFAELTEVVNDQQVCTFTMTVNGTLLNALFSLGFSLNGVAFSAELAEAALGDYLRKMHVAATGTRN
ncbi:hypothetical protein ABU178_08555 [Pantoea osteomyelitidis]|uniref:Uncharacterized protein n=1 Tax=Pantoea osteomyelitidis TaxID=3230026 RepID=A0ABW7PV89_9GAMM